LGNSGVCSHPDFFILEENDLYSIPYHITYIYFAVISKMAEHDYSDEKPKPKPFRPDLKRCLKGRSSLICFVGCINF
jgi:hypothetical protein